MNGDFMMKAVIGFAGFVFVNRIVLKHLALVTYLTIIASIYMVQEVSVQSANWKYSNLSGEQIVLEPGECCRIPERQVMSAGSAQECGDPTI